MAWSTEIQHHLIRIFAGLCLTCMEFQWHGNDFSLGGTQQHCMSPVWNSHFFSLASSSHSFLVQYLPPLSMGFRDLIQDGTGNNGYTHIDGFQSILDAIINFRLKDSVFASASCHQVWHSSCLAFLGSIGKQTKIYPADLGPLNFSIGIKPCKEVRLRFLTHFFTHFPVLVSRLTFPR